MHLHTHALTHPHTHLLDLHMHTLTHSHTHLLDLHYSHKLTHSHTHLLDLQSQTHTLTHSPTRLTVTHSHSHIDTLTHSPTRLLNTRMPGAMRGRGSRSERWIRANPGRTFNPVTVSRSKCRWKKKREDLGLFWHDSSNLIQGKINPVLLTLPSYTPLI